MTFDATHRPWLVALGLLCALTAGAYRVPPVGVTPSSALGLLFGLGGMLLALFCALLPVRRQLQRVHRVGRWRIFRSAAWEKGHIYFGLLACVLFHCHAGFRAGGPLTAVLLAVLWAIVLSGLLGLLFRHLLPLVKSAREGKALIAAQIIGTTHSLTLRLHVPLTVTLLILALIHAVVSLLY
jgi:hypothetical protein